MLLKRIKEFQAFNASKESAKVREHGEGSGSTQKEKRARFAEKVKYPEKVHVITDYMIEGTNDANWNETCHTKAREGNFVIPNVHYKPEVTFNVLSFDLLEEQGYVVKISNNKCNIHYMFGGARTGKAHDENLTEDEGLKDVVIEHNKFLDKYFESIEPKDEESLVKGLEGLKWDRDDVYDYVDEEYISWNRSLYAIKKKIPPMVGVMEINLLSLHKMVDNLGGYLLSTLAKMPWYEKMPKEDVVESSSGNARVKDPQGKEKDDAGKEDALEEDMNKETKFGVRLESNLEKEAEEGSITDSNDF
ncbi:hypothetical protein Tco_0443404 [Tanacetum coccineum]